MTACLFELAQQWEARGWREQAAGRPDVAQALWRCARELRRDLDPELRESCEWPPVTRVPTSYPTQPPLGGAMDDFTDVYEGPDDPTVYDLDDVRPLTGEATEDEISDRFHDTDEDGESADDDMDGATEAFEGEGL